MEPLILTPDELQALTGRQRCHAQVRVLRAMGIEHRTRPDGTLCVSRAHVEHLLNPGKRPKVTAREPNWEALAPRS